MHIFSLCEGWQKGSTVSYKLSTQRRRRNFWHQQLRMFTITGTLYTGASHFGFSNAPFLLGDTSSILLLFIVMSLSGEYMIQSPPISRIRKITNKKTHREINSSLRNVETWFRKPSVSCKKISFFELFLKSLYNQTVHPMTPLKLSL